MRAARRCFGRETNDVFTTVFRKRAARIDLWPDRIAVMDKEEPQVSTLNSQATFCRLVET